jgi:tripartite-type tricarboxylate transporter receptor subunit TctC
MPRTRLAALAALLAMLPALAPAYAELPSGKPIRLIVAYPPGGVSDEVARALAEGVTRRSGVRVIVENRGGAGGVVALQSLARAPADGTTIVFCAISPLVLGPRTGVPGFEPRDVVPVMSVMTTPMLLLGTPALAGDTLASAVAAARDAPGAIRWATSGVATTGHRVLEEVEAASGARFTHIPYRGGGPQLADAIAGEFEILSSNVAPLQLDYVRDQRLKPLAVGAPARLAVLPEVPTLAELGYPGANLWSTFGLFAPAATPRAVVDALGKLFNAALRAPELLRRLEAASNVATGGTPEDFALHIARERSAASRD